MGIESCKQGKLLYHLTKLDNLDSILENGLLSRRKVKDKEVEFKDVADQEIISKRKELGLDQYTPFHFHPYSAFDVAVKNTYSEEFIYICILREDARKNNFLVLPIHPLSLEEMELFEYDQGFNNIDWNTMQTVGTTDDYSKHVKMAECLTNLDIPAQYFQCIYVKSEETKKLVQKKLKAYGINGKPPYITVQVWL